ncbi:NADH-ubiquinone oxidoreductase chain 4-like [Apium graveolens]|uniref:NADH-ubiquinone oxidoreductase chain 4-like n=1 Tax=Apium graveolens TaxID=4045 RepID=UPI003D7BB35F
MLEIIQQRAPGEIFSWLYDWRNPGLPPEFTVDQGWRRILTWVKKSLAFLGDSPTLGSKMKGAWAWTEDSIIVSLSSDSTDRRSIPRAWESKTVSFLFSALALILHARETGHLSIYLGDLSINRKGIGGSIPPISSHGLVSSALFLCVGVLYDRHKTRLVRYYGGSVSTMPNLPTIFFSSTLANMSSPGTSSFIGEFLILVGAFQRNSLVATLAALGKILGAAYFLWLYNRAVSGNLKPDFLHKFSDPNGREVSVFIPFLVGVVRMGVHPKVFPDRMHTSVSNLVQHGKFN